MLRFTKGSNSGKRKQALFFPVFLCLLVVFTPLHSASQPMDASPMIAEVSVVVDGQSSGEDMERLIPIKEGDSFSLKRINTSIKQVYRTGLFSDIQVLKEGDEKIHLTFLLTRKLFARRIVFQTEEKLPKQKLKTALFSLREGSFFTEEKLDKAIGELKKALIQEGYFNPEIGSYTKKDPQNSSVDVFFKIDSVKRFKIKEIAFSREAILPVEELKRVMKSRKGKEYIPSVLEEDITRISELYNLKDYQRAEVELGDLKFNEQEGNVSLFLNVIPHEKIEIEVRGAKIPPELLRPIWETRIFEEWGLTEGDAKILGYMRKKGYLFAQVTSSIQKEDNRMRVIHTVTPNRKYRIQDISYNGLNYFAPYQLEAELGVGERSPLLRWIDGERLFKLPEEIEYLYKSRGFPDARVDLNFVRKRRGVEVLFFIQEGEQERIGNISFEGARLFSPETLFEQISSSKGGPFHQPSIQKDIEKVESFYLDQGIRGTSVAARVEKVKEGLFSLIFQIDEGNKVRVEKIVITGNVVTNRKTILRELRIKEGDYAYYDKISESKRRLERLGIFTRVRIEEISLSPESVNLVIDVREGERNYASLGLGLETKTEPRTFAVWNNPFRLRGTAELIRNNIFGSAAQLSLVGQLSLKEKRGVLSWEQPYVFGLPLQTYVNVWLERESRKSFTYDRQGLSLTALKPVSENLLFLATLRWAETTLVGLEIQPNEVDRQFFPFSATSVSGSFILDRRDDPFNPERGSFFSFALEKAFPLLKDESNYLKTFIKSQHFVPILSGINFSLTARLGLGGGKMDIPIHERFFAGGSNSFRGARFDELGPVDADSLKPVGGEALALLNLELTFPLISTLKDLKGTFFYDVGNVFEEREDVSLASLKSAVGFGLRYRTPLGPIRLELGWNLSVPREERYALFFITIGNVF
ncbi:MAG: outer membrane protein assembly factor BamA [Candidatus Aminicenantes bacterium]|nr:outer membrane protein assembly factor BamA [Candidatus Aminicenantes bacterium]MDH5706155.1 outer membrane protein assembly factor BamA [Candidatus Aminicenantes bacterium]